MEAWVYTCLILFTSCLIASGSVCVEHNSSDEKEYASLMLLGKITHSEEYQNRLEKIQQQLDHLKKSSKEYFRDCEEAYEYGKRKSGVYTIQPDDDAAFDVYCDMETDSGGWTVFQRRKDGSEDFYREWMDYARGFGNLTDEFWLGLRKIHRITSLSADAAGNELRVDLEDFEGNTAFAKYLQFNIGSSSQQYALTIGKYRGTAGDSMGSHNGYKFSTKDIDNDSSNDKCAVVYKGAWWYRSCHASNLNGLYLGGDHSTYADGVNWKAWKGFYYSLKSTEMKVRRL